MFLERGYSLRLIEGDEGMASGWKELTGDITLH